MNGKRPGEKVANEQHYCKLNELNPIHTQTHNTPTVLLVEN